MPDLALLRRSRAALLNSLLSSLLVLSLHLLILFFALRASGVLSRPAKVSPPGFLSLISAAPEKPKQVQPKSAPPSKAPLVQVTMAAALTPSTPVPKVTNPPAPTATMATSAPIASPAEMPPVQPPTVSEARFDAAYLNNPPPNYPMISRRNGEAGKVLLLVKVSKDGVAAQVEIAQSCGYARLDQAALEAVRHWRFVPARRGDEAIAASVLVPLTFRLNS